MPVFIVMLMCIWSYIHGIPRLESLATVLLEQGLLEDAILSQDSVQSQVSSHPDIDDLC